MRNMFQATLQKFEIPQENALCLVVDNTCNMTKTVEWVNENNAPDSTDLDENKIHNQDVDEVIDSDDDLVINIHHMRSAVHNLQPAIRDSLKQLQCEKLLTKHIVAKLRFPNVLA